jgi:hypothetical protein
MLIACFAGYIWLYFSLLSEQSIDKPIEVCLVKHFTNIPCPSCGSTRSILALLKGDFMEAFDINPLGFLIAIIMVLSPLWIIVDIAAKKNTLFDFYQKTENYIKRPQLAIPLILLALINWIWNIIKGL